MLFGGKKGVRRGEKWHERLLANEKCAKAIDFGKFYRAPENKRMLNRDVISFPEE